MMLNLFSYIFLAILATLLVAPIAMLLARRWDLMDDPDSAPHKIHHTPIPRVGGLLLFPVFLMGNLLIGGLQDTEIRSILLASIVIFVFGLWDDRKGLTAWWKFLGQFLATALLIAGGVQVQFAGRPLLNIAITAFWVVGITNALNLVDSMDGLAVGLAGLASAFFMLVTQDAGQTMLASFSALLLGACIGIYYFNAAPARLFLGDAGAQLLGFLLASLAIAYTPPGFPQASSWFVPILLLGVPIFDTSLVTLSRLRRRQPVFRGHIDHTYHRLVFLGMSPSRAVLTMHVIAILLGCIALIAMTLPPLWANTTFAACLLIGLAILFYLEAKGCPNEPTISPPGNRTSQAGWISRAE